MLALADIERYSWLDDNARRRQRRGRASMIDALEMMLRAVEARDAYTCGHAQRVAEYSAILSTALGQPQRDAEECRIGGLLHDIGKIGIADAILQKPNVLAQRERADIEAHPEVGASIVGSIPFMRSILPFILCHHERWDGNGYPARLHAHAIPIHGRICAVADAFDAMTSGRPYRPAQNLDYAVCELKRCRETQFDPDCVDAFLCAIEANLVAATLSTAR